MRKHERELRRTFQAAGYHVSDVHISRHLHWDLISPCGKPIRLVTSKTPSCSRTVANTLRSAKRAVQATPTH